MSKLYRLNMQVNGIYILYVRNHSSKQLYSSIIVLYVSSAAMIR